MRLILGTALFALIAVGIVMVGLPYLVTRSGFGLFYDSGYVRFLGYVPLTAGALMWIFSARHFIVFGRGTPAPIYPPVKLVNFSIFRSVRNPMYLGVLLILLGEAILFQSITLYVYVIGVWLAFHLFVVFYEEPRLQIIFGRIYEEYLNSVPRWIPRLYAFRSKRRKGSRQQN